MLDGAMIVWFALTAAEHVMTELPAGRTVAIIAGTFVTLFAAVWLTNLVVPVRF